VSIPPGRVIAASEDSTVKLKTKIKVKMAK
jgi:hypothetical protein